MKCILIFFCIIFHHLIDFSWTSCVIKTYPSFLSAIQAADVCTLPTNNFNTSCISAGCPQLKGPGLCPLLSNGSYNFSAINQSLAIASKCFQQQGTICNTPITKIPFPPISVLLLNILDPLPLNATATVKPDVSVINSLSQATFTLISNSSNSDLIVDINNPYYNYSGVLKMEFVFGGILGTLLQPNNSIVFDNVTALFNMSFNGIVRMVLNKKTPTFEVQQINLIPKLQLSLLNFTDLLQLLNIREMVEDVLSNIAKNSDVSNATANFFGTFLINALQITSQNCPKKLQ